MRILITGASGLIGSALTSYFSKQGHEVISLSRRPGGERTILWNPAAGQIDGDPPADLDFVVNLAGDPIAAGKWNPEKKARIRDSRVKGTRLLSEWLAKAESKPRVLISGSAIGYYGDRRDEILTEDSTAGSDFLAEVGKEWESACASAAGAGIRVVNIRTGIVLSADGGALAKMLPPFKMAAGGPMGSGRQWMSWIAVDDFGPALMHIIEEESLSGPVNLVAPNPVTNREFAQTLGRALGRPAFIPAPPFALRMMFGEFADAVLLSSQRVIPRKLTDSGFIFQYRTLESALRHILRK